VLRNTERSEVAPPVLQREVPATPVRLQGELPPPPVFTSQYNPEIPEYDEPYPDPPDHQQPVNLPISIPLPPTQPSSSTVHDVRSPLTEPGPSSASSGPSHKRKKGPEERTSKKKRRTCQKCAQVGCSGASSRKYCKNPCQDCSKSNCRGRNSQHPSKTCEEGWDYHHKEMKF
jgi:hypothetical protein